jgi:cysteine desulfurase
MRYEWQTQETKKIDLPILDFDREKIREEIRKEMLSSCSSDYASYSPLCPSPKSERMHELTSKKFNQFIYLDNNATHPVLPKVANKIREMYDVVGNPSSRHEAGERTRAYLEQARAKIANKIGCKPSNLIFTASGSESNNMVIKGTFNKVIISSIEHSCIINSSKKMNAFEVGVFNNGYIDLEKVIELSKEPCLVSIMTANNETGSILPIHDYVNEIKFANPNALVHSDMCQCLGKMKDVKVGNLDFATFTAHKFGGPVGVSVLYIKDMNTIKSFIQGGHQEWDKRAGTYNMPLIVGMGEAIDNLVESDLPKIEALRNYMEDQLVKFGATINCKNSPRLVNTSSITFKEIYGEKLIEHLSNKGIFISAGSACNANEKKPSYVLKALDLTDEEAFKSVRISLNRFNTIEEIDILIKEIILFSDTHTI